MAPTKRVSAIDTAKGIGMLIVLLLHVSINYPGNDYLGSPFHLFVSTFFMPIFFVCSGLFFSVKQDFKTWIVKKIKRLLIPYWCFYLLTYLLNVALHLMHVQTKNPFEYTDLFQVFWKDVFSNNVIWFLLALFWSSIMMYFILKTGRWFYELPLVILCYAIGVYFDQSKINIPLYVDTAFSAMPLLYVGVLMKRANLIQKVMDLKCANRLIGLVVLALVAGVVNYLCGQGVSMVSNQIGNPFMFLGGAIFGSICVIAICLIVQKIPVVTYIGENSMIMLCTHMYLINLFVLLIKKLFVKLGTFNDLFNDFWIHLSVVAVLVCLSMYVVVPFFKRFLPWMVGEPSKKE